ncbi:restriction endonuclease subunit S [bacterium]|nr:restriction endonuclease subunit S [bacterium]
MAETKNKSTFHHIEIPEDWEFRKLGDIGKIRMCKRVFNHETSEEGDIPFFKIGTFGKEPDAFISKELYENYRKKFSFPKVGDILISAAGTLGRTVVYDGSPAYFQDSNIVWIDNDESLVINRYLFYIYQTIKYESEGGTIQRLYNGIISDAKFLRPPLPEQKAIAQVLSTADAAIHTTEKLIAQKELRKKWLMQQLLTGKKRLKGFDGEWEKQPLKNFIKQVSRKIDKPNHPYLGIGLRSHGKGTFLKPDEDPAKNSMDSFYVVRPNDLIVNITFAWEQAIAIVRPEDDGALASHRFPTYTFKEEKGHPDFFKFFILQPKMKYMLELISPGGAGRNRVMSKSDFIKLEFLVPDYQEQIAIAQVLQAADKEISLLKAKAEKLREQKKGLMQVLLTGKKRLL